MISRFFTWFYRKGPFITWHFYVPWYMFATAMMIWCLVVKVGGLQDGDLRCLWTLSFTTTPIFFPWFKNVTVWPRRLP